MRTIKTQPHSPSHMHIQVREKEIMSFHWEKHYPVSCPFLFECIRCIGMHQTQKGLTVRGSCGPWERVTHARVHTLISTCYCTYPRTHAVGTQEGKSVLFVLAPQSATTTCCMENIKLECIGTSKYGNICTNPTYALKSLWLVHS